MSLSRFLPYLRPYWRALAWLLLAMLIAATTALVLPTTTQRVIDSLAQGTQAELYTTILPQVLILTGVAILANVWKARAVERLAQRALVDLRVDLFHRLMGLSPGQLHREGVGQGMSRVLNDTQTVVGTLFGTIPGVLTSLLRVALIIGVMLWMHPLLTLLSLASLPLIILLSHRGGTQIRHGSTALRAALGRYSAHLEQALARTKFVQASNLEVWERRQFKAASEQLQGIHLGLRFRQIHTETLVGLVTIAWPLAVLILGAGEIVRGGLTIGGLVAFNIYLSSLFGPIQSLSGAFLEMQATLAALDRLEAIPRAVQGTVGEQDRLLAPGPLTFEGVGFCHEGQKGLLQEISFTLTEGEICALVGPSGSGKSTLLDLILGFYRPGRGRITLGGVDLQALGLAQLRQQIAWVPQDPPFFAGTVRQNLVWGLENLPEEELQRAVALAGLEPLLARLPQGLDHPIGERGSTLSGGERQRLAIARAVLRRSRILLLDEPTGSLDTEAEAALWESLNQLKRTCAILVVVHRLTMLHQADRILVLQDGRLVENGHFTGLMSANGAFADLYRQAVGD